MKQISLEEPLIAFLCFCVPFQCALLWTFFLVGVFVLLSLMEMKDRTFALGSGACLWNEPLSSMALLTAHIDCKHLEDGGWGKHDLTFHPCPCL